MPGKGIATVHRVPEHIIQDIVRRVDFVRLIGRYTRLSEKGGKHWGLCPFHNEKTPSFSVDPGRGLYYCFGCKEGGNIFTFLKKLEGLEFLEALQQLAEDAGVDLSQFRDEPDDGKKVQSRYLREINELASVYYAKCLRKARGSGIARDYLKKRAIEKASVDKWGIGYAPEGWDNFINFARGRQLDMNNVEIAGLVVPRKKGEGYYDRFRNRLIFPVCDRNGRVIGFGARALDEEQDAKYLNSPETPIFNKRSCFYGLEHARKAIRSSGVAVIVEGYTDVIMAHQHGFENVIAVLGTTLTDSHAGILSRLCEKVILLFDSDEAGQKSAEKSIYILLGHDIEPCVSSLPGGLDPCDFLFKHGAEAFKGRLEESEDFLMFCLKNAAQDRDMGQRSERTKVFQSLAEMAAAIQNQVRREMLVREIANELGVEPQNAFDYVAGLLHGRRSGSVVTQDGNATTTKRITADQRCLGGILTLLLVDPQYQQKIADEEVFTPGLFEETPERELLALLLERCKESGPVTESDFLYMLADDKRVKDVRDAVEKERKYAAGDKDARLQGYLEHIKKKKNSYENKPGENGLEDDEQWLKNYIEMLRREEHK